MEDKSQTENAGYTDLQEILDTAVLLREALIHENRSTAEIEVFSVFDFPQIGFGVFFVFTSHLGAHMLTYSLS